MPRFSAVGQLYLIPRDRRIHDVIREEQLGRGRHIFLIDFILAAREITRVENGPADRLVPDLDNPNIHVIGGQNVADLIPQIIEISSDLGV